MWHAGHAEVFHDRGFGEAGMGGALEGSAVLVAKEGVRRLEAGDYAKGYLDLLAKLTTVGEVTEPMFLDQVRFFGSEAGGDYAILVVPNRDESTILATGTLVVERKLIHGCGRVGHVEDVVVLPEARGQGLGHRVVSALVDEAKSRGCYKVILDCAEENKGFYEKAGMRQKEVQMVRYL